MVFQSFPSIKKELWGGSFWTSGYYANIVGQYGNLEVIKNYVENQGKEYKQIYTEQLRLW
jgi:REP element-mobilizing transposase RayT